MVILLLNIYDTKFKLDLRYTGWVNEYPTYKYAHSITPYLRKIGIKPKDKIISLPDETPNYTLYLFQQSGWTQAFDNNLDQTQIEKNINLGAKYLICIGSETSKRDYLKKYTTNKAGEYGNITIYKLNKWMQKVK